MKRITLFCAIALAIFSAGCGSGNSIPWNQNVLTYVARSEAGPTLYTLDYKTKKIVPLGIPLPAEANYVTASQDGTKAAYCRYNGDTYDMYVMDKKGAETDLTTITSGPCEPAFSPDGKTLVYMNNYQLYTIGVDGSNQTSVLSDSGFYDHSPRFSPDGKTLSFYRYYYNNSDADVAPAVSSHQSTSHAAKKPRVRKAAATPAINSSTSGVYTLSLSANATPQLVLQTQNWWGPATFSPDGTKLLVTDCDLEAPCSIATINLDGTYLLTVLPNTSGNDYFSPVQVGSVILFNTWNDYESIYVMNLDGSSPTQVIDDTNVASGLIDTYWEND